MVIALAAIVQFVGLLVLIAGLAWLAGPWVLVISGALLLLAPELIGGGKKR